MTRPIIESKHTIIFIPSTYSFPWIAVDDTHIKVCDASQIHYRTEHFSRTTGRTISVTLENIVADSIAECGFRSSYYNGP